MVTWLPALRKKRPEAEAQGSGNGTSESTGTPGEPVCHRHSTESNSTVGSAKSSHMGDRNSCGSQYSQGTFHSSSNRGSEKSTCPGQSVTCSTDSNWGIGSHHSSSSSSTTGPHFKPAFNRGATKSYYPHNHSREEHNTEVRLPLRILLLCHGQSEASVNREITKDVPDHALHLTERGRQEAADAGLRLRDIVQDESVSFIVSPHVRTRETFAGAARAFGPVENLKVLQDVQIRDQDRGNFDRQDLRELRREKKEFGQFYYRFPEGESCADVYDRASLFLESLCRLRDVPSEDNVVLVTHGIFILVFLMRLCRYSCEDFYMLDNLQHGEIVALERDDCDSAFNISYTWCVEQSRDYDGLRLKPEQAYAKSGLRTTVWDGDKGAALIVSSPYVGPLSRMAKVKEVVKKKLSHREPAKIRAGSMLVTPTQSENDRRRVSEEFRGADSSPTLVACGSVPANFWSKTDVTPTSSHSSAVSHGAGGTSVANQAWHPVGAK